MSKTVYIAILVITIPFPRLYLLCCVGREVGVSDHDIYVSTVVGTWVNETLTDILYQYQTINVKQ